MNTLKILSRTVILFSIVTTMYACASESYLRTDRAVPEDLAGTYTLLLHGGRHSDDVVNVAILDKEGDPYTIEIYAPEFDYRVKKGLSADDALSEAEALVRYHRDFMRSRLSKIIDKDGATIGYELRPLYHAHRLGQSDILYIDYKLKDHTVMTVIRLKDYLLDRDLDIMREKSD